VKSSRAKGFILKKASLVTNIRLISAIFGFLREKVEALFIKTDIFPAYGVYTIGGLKGFLSSLHVKKSIASHVLLRTDQRRYIYVEYRSSTKEISGAFLEPSICLFKKDILHKYNIYFKITYSIFCKFF
jgi:hypothetical protein